jgi:Domain of unknown function (DUF4936)
MRLYVYYRVAEADVDVVAANFASTRTRLRSLHPGWACEFLRRPEARDEQVTLMEVHTGLGADALEAISTEVGKALAPWLHGPRQVERFGPLDVG